MDPTWLSGANTMIETGAEVTLPAAASDAITEMVWAPGLSPASTKSKGGAIVATFWTSSTRRVADLMSGETVVVTVKGSAELIKRPLTGEVIATVNKVGAGWTTMVPTMPSPRWGMQ